MNILQNNIKTLQSCSTILIRRTILFILLVFQSYVSIGQTDTEFWFAVPAVTAGHENKPIVFRLTSYDKPAKITISQPANSNFPPVEISIGSFGTYEYDLTAFIEQVESKPSGKVLGNAIRITSTANISAYYEVGKQFNPEIFPLKGKSAKGLNFIIPSQTRYNNESTRTPAAQNGFVIVATENNTQVVVTLSNPDAGGHLANVPFTIILQKGETYSVKSASLLGSLHLGGTIVTSDKSICITIYDDSVLTIGNYDLIGDQIVPINNTGNEFILVRGALSTTTFPNTDMYYIWATEDQTEIFINGSTTTTITLNKGKSYEGQLLNNSLYIKTSKPVYILQLTGIGGELTATSLPSIQCTGSSNVSFVRSTAEDFYLNIICRASDVAGFSLGGDPTILSAHLFMDVPGATGWKAARIDKLSLNNFDNIFQAGQAISVTNSLGLFHLGFLNGSNATGARLGYFSNYSKVTLAPNIITSSCLGGDIQLEAQLLPNVNYTWKGPNGFESTLHNPIITAATILDSGFYFVEANVVGCGTSTDSVHINIHPLPSLALVKSRDTVCFGSEKELQLNLTGKAPWTLVYNDGIVSDTIRNLLEMNSSIFVAPTTSRIYNFLSLVDSNACSSAATIIDIKDTIIVNQLPIPQFTISPIHCEGNITTFSDASSADLDELSDWYWDFGNGVQMHQNINTPIEVPFSTWGSYTVQMAVVSSLGCKSDTIEQVIQINAKPRVGFILPKICLEDAIAYFVDTSSSPDRSANNSYLWNFNAGMDPIENVPIFDQGEDLKPNPAVHYQQEATYAVQLRVKNDNGCIDSLTQSFTINGAIPKAYFTVLKDTALCTNEAVVIKDSSWVNFGSIGKLQIHWGDGKDTIVNDPIPNKKYIHLYDNASVQNHLNYTILLNAYSGGKCFEDSSFAIQMVAPPSSVNAFSSINTLCINDSLVIRGYVNGGVGPFQFEWFTDVDYAFFVDSVIHGTKEGQVNAQLLLKDTKNCHYLFKDLLSFSIPPLPIATFTALDTVICNGDSVTLKGNGADTYLWYKNGALIKTDKIDTIRIGESGFYTLKVNDGFCNSLSSAGIDIIDFQIPYYSFNHQSSICINTPLNIRTDAINKFKMHFDWDFGDNTKTNLANPLSHTYTENGKYVIQLQVTNDYCPKYDYFLLGDSIEVVNPAIGNHFIMYVLADQDTLLSPLKVDSGYDQYSWTPAMYLSNPFIANPFFNGQRSVNYVLTRTNPITLCIVKDNYQLDVSSDVVIAIPKAFTPNGDQLNDFLKIEYGAGLKSLRNFIIFNRFGRIVFQTNQLTHGWDGKLNGIDQEMDAYTYFLEYLNYKDENVKRTGSFLLIK